MSLAEIEAQLERQLDAAHQAHLQGAPEHVWRLMQFRAFCERETALLELNRDQQP